MSNILQTKEIILTLTQFFKANEATSPSFEMTIPGLSKSLIFLSNLTSCSVLVRPGVEPNRHACERFKLLIKLLLPVLGKP